MSSIYATMYGLPDCKTADPEEWNEAWEKVFWLGGGQNARKLIDAMASIKEGFDRNHSLSIYRNRLRMVFEQQKSNSAYVSIEFIRNDLEAKWLECGKATRRKHILEGLVRTSIYMEDLRMQTPDITVELLEKQGGQGFLTLLRHYQSAPNSGTEVAEPTYYDNDMWKGIFADVSGYSEDVLIQLNLTRLSRENFITTFVWNTLQSFAGQPPDTSRGVTQKHNERPTIKITEAQRRPVKNILGPNYRTIMKGHRDDQKNGVHTCDNCVGPISQKLVCVACKNKVARNIFYCSRECQKANWSLHKKVCGKTLTLETATTSVIPPRCDPIGPAVGGYKRNAYLSNQVELCNTYPDADYVIPFPGSLPRLFEGSDLVRPLFRKYRDEAMTTGDMTAIGFISQQLIHGALEQDCASNATSGVRPDIIELFRDSKYVTSRMVEQLNKEYGFSVLPLVVELDLRKIDPLGEARSKLEIEAGLNLKFQVFA